MNNESTAIGVVRIEFPNIEMASHFVRWMDGQGEQDYWTWMDCREEEEPGEIITATKFTYSYEPDNGVFKCRGDPEAMK